MSTKETINVGSKFTERYRGYTVTGFGVVSKGWEVVSQEEDGQFNCKLLWDDSIMGGVNPNYIRKMSEEEIHNLSTKLGL